MKITREFLMEHRTKNGAWTKAQVEAIGIEWPPRVGWIQRAILKEITEEQANLFKSGKSKYISRAESKKNRNTDVENKTPEQIQEMIEYHEDLSDYHNEMVIYLRSYLETMD